MAAISVGQVALDLVLGNTASFKNSVSQQANSATSVFGSAFKKIASFAVAAFSVKAITAFSKECIELGSDLAEVQNVVDVTFGKGAEKINAWAKTTSTAFGVSELSAKQYAGTMGAMLKSMGLSTSAAADMSTTIAGLAGDMASFYNLDTDTAFEKIRSGISGETEPLKQLGINMSVANLEAYALAQGISTSYSKMSQSNQALLRYNYLLSVTSDAQGDFARTSDSWANQTRILKLNFDSLKASIGQVLINALTPFLKKLNALISYANTAANAIARLFGNETASSAGQSASAMGSVSSSALQAADDMTSAGEAAAKTAKKINASFLSIDEINVLGKNDDDETDNTQISPIVNTADFTAANTQMSETEKRIGSLEEAIVSFTNHVNELVDRVDWKGAAQKLSNAVVKLLGSINTALENFDWKNLGKKIKDFITNINWEDLGKETGRLFSNVFVSGLDLLRGFISGDEENGKTLTDCLTDFVAKAIANIQFGEIIAKLFDAIQQAFTIPLKKIFGEDSLIGIVTDGISGLIDYLSENGFFTIEGFKDGIKNGFSNVRQWIADNIVVPFIQHFCSLFGINSPSTVMKEKGGFLMDGLKNGVKEKVDSVIETVTSLWTSLKDWYSTKVAPKFTKDYWKQKFGAIGDALKDTINHKILSHLNKLINKINSYLTISVSSPASKVLNALGANVSNGSFKIFSIPNVPYLAQGGYLPANSPRLAMVGDNTREGEIVSPESKIREQVTLALGSFNGDIEALLSEVIKILRQILEKNPNVRAYVTTSDVTNAINRASRRNGAPVL